MTTTMKALLWAYAALMMIMFVALAPLKAQSVPIASPASGLAANATVTASEIPAGSTAAAVAKAWSWKLYFDAAAPVVAVPTECVGTAPVVCSFATPFVNLAAGAHSIAGTASNSVGEGPKSASFAFLLLKSTPGAPVLSITVVP